MTPQQLIGHVRVEGLVYRIVLLCFASCVADDTAEDVPCNLDPDVGLWCTHGHNWTGPLDTGDGCPTPSSEGSVPCGAFDEVSSGAGVQGVNHYFLDGEHVATLFWSDVVSICTEPVSPGSVTSPNSGATPYWYGQVIDCP